MRIVQRDICMSCNAVFYYYRYTVWELNITTNLGIKLEFPPFRASNWPFAFISFRDWFSKLVLWNRPWRVQVFSKTIELIIHLMFVGLAVLVISTKSYLTFVTFDPIALFLYMQEPPYPNITLLKNKMYSSPS